MTQGYFAFVLHSHLPYVLSHGRWPHGTDWLTEAAAETYLPILRILHELVDQGLKPRLTIGLSPVLCEQLADDGFKTEFESYLKQKLRAAQDDAEQFYRYHQPKMLKMAQFWENFYSLTLDHFNSIDREIITQFRQLQEAGILEIITCGATHGYLPLLSRDESVQAQVKMAVRNYRHHFGCNPRGIWLPECAYRPRYEWTPPVDIDGKRVTRLRKGVDEFLSENELDFFIVDSVLLKGGKSIGVYIDRFEALKLLWESFEKQYQPRDEETDKTAREVYLVASAPDGKKPIAVFSRDPETGVLVWSGEDGYPGDGHYLDFHKKRFPGGLRYWEVTSSGADLADKREYLRQAAMERIPENSDHFSSKVEAILGGYFEKGKQPGILVAPYDTELFGHWWFEGPDFLKRVLKNLCESETVSLTFLSEHLDRRSPSTVISLPEGSWGQGNHHYIWLNDQNQWTWKHIYESEEAMCRLASKFRDNADRCPQETADLLKQMARELMLMSASDWQFLISTFSARDYAELRLTEHYDSFKRLATMVENLLKGQDLADGDREFYEACCARDRLFSDIDINWFAAVEYPAKS